MPRKRLLVFVLLLRLFSYYDYSISNGKQQPYVACHATSSFQATYYSNGKQQLVIACISLVI